MLLGLDLDIGRYNVVSPDPYFGETTIPGHPTLFIAISIIPEWLDRLITLRANLPSAPHAKHAHNRP